MTDFTAVNTEVQKLIDQALAADSVVDAAALQAALAADAAADAAVLKAKDDEIARLTAALAACEAGHPPPVDTTAPSIPAGLTATVVSSSQINLGWSASTDAVGVTGYIVFRNGTQVGTTTSKAYSNTGLTASTTYSYTVKARDAAGNMSAASAAVSATTQAGSTGFPDATNTGFKGTLTPYSGPYTITVAGTVIENKTITKSIRVTAANVVIKNCAINFSDYWGIDGDGAPNLTVQDCTIVGPGGSFTGKSAVLGVGHFLRNNISKVENGLVLQGGACEVRGNYIHDLQTSGADPHYDGIEAYGLHKGLVIANNTIAARDTSCIFVANLWGAIDDVLIDHNLLTGADMPCRTEGWKSNAPVTRVRWTNNVIQKGYWGTWDLERSSPSSPQYTASAWDVTKSGNVNTAGQPV